MFNDYPHTDLHELNLDWVIKKVKELSAAWAQTAAAWEDQQEAFNVLKSWIENYFATLDVQVEINNKLDALVADGTISELIAPYVASGLPAVVADQIGTVVAAQIGAVVAAQIGAVVATQLPDIAAAAAASEVSDWLAAHVDPETGYVIDDSLTIQGAAADAKVTGDAIGELKSALTELYDSASDGNIYVDLLNDLEIGSINISTGEDSASSVRLRTNTQHEIYAESIDFTLSDDWNISTVVEYDETHTFLRASSEITASKTFNFDPRTKYFRAVFYQIPQVTYTKVPTYLGVSAIFSALNSRDLAVKMNTLFNNVHSTENLFKYGIRVGFSTSFVANSKYAISKPFNIGGKSISVRATKLPAGVKYGVCFKNDQDAYTMWGLGYISDESTNYNANALHRTDALVLFAKTDNTNISASDLIGLELVIVNGQTNNIQTYIPQENMVDYSSDEPKEIKVVSYNVGHYTKGTVGSITDTTIANMKNILCLLDADVIGLQENKVSFNDTTEQAVFYDALYGQKYLLDTPQLGMVSKYQLFALENDKFSTDRGYTHGIIKVGRNDVDWFNFHLSPTSTDRTTELSEIVSIISNKKYVICTGDFNTGNDTGGDVDELETFTNAGFKAANCGYFGRYNTHIDAYGNKALDNIIVSPNIYISKVDVPSISDDVNPSDHLPFVAYLTII